MNDTLKQPAPHKPRNKKKTWLVFLGSALISLLVLGFVFQEGEKAAPDERTDRAGTGMPVTVRTVSPNRHPALITALGEVTPLWQTALKSQVNGRVIELSSKLLPGNEVRQGEALVQLEDSAYRQQLNEARGRLAMARVQLLREEREASEARANWKRSGIEGEPESDLVLRVPQVEAARAEVASAESAVEHARTQLEQTTILAPYDGLIVERFVNPGASLFAGDEVAHLVGLDAAEVAVQLDAEQWSLLPRPLESATIELVDPERDLRWRASAVRDSRRLGSATRLRTLYLRVERPLAQSPPLLPGTFVRAEITGKSLENVLLVPEGALTKQGLIWYVDGQDRLRAWLAKALFWGEGSVYVAPPQEAANGLRIAIAPHAGFTRGLAVQPRQGE
ncbi:Efflux RND transporter periplasmic adaptor subunit [Sulfidibacter corallicola]|uniref:Efflux RND transporter periplasmic adaptor subunit n=1 Tax=Sulfidibacter corallicola TaxID=2818388 RepID=A0A8A4TM85_SULCO|nr:efflux RND transporter periplasmic adaptor subunit [Sulfidibacter corallicola]QTD50663.1 efflux RND transporter periplasmic adaptor subunit [Sulfidibacter corallicola]